MLSSHQWPPFSGNDPSGPASCRHSRIVRAGGGKTHSESGLLGALGCRQTCTRSPSRLQKKLLNDGPSRSRTHPAAEAALMISQKRTRQSALHPISIQLKTRRLIFVTTHQEPRLRTDRPCRAALLRRRMALSLFRTDRVMCAVFSYCDGEERLFANAAGHGEDYELIRRLYIYTASVRAQAFTSALS